MGLDHHRLLAGFADDEPSSVERLHLLFEQFQPEYGREIHGLRHPRFGD